MKQRDKMRELFARYRYDEEATVYAYAQAEEKGEIDRKSNIHGLDAITYAKALMRDGKRRGWLAWASELHV